MESRVTGEISPQSFTAISPMGQTASLPYLEFRPIRIGTKTATVSNRGQQIPLHFELTLSLDSNNPRVAMQIALDSPGLNVQDIKDALAFLKILNIPQSKLELVPYKTRVPLSLPRPESADMIDLDDGFADSIDKLCVIQQKTGVRLALKELVIDAETADEIDEVFSVVTTGKYIYNKRAAFGMFSKSFVRFAIDAIRQQRTINLTTENTPTFSDILDTRIDLGLSTQNIFSIPLNSEQELQEIEAKTDEGDTVRLKMLHISGTAEYPEWQPQKPTELNE